MACKVLVDWSQKVAHGVDVSLDPVKSLPSVCIFKVIKPAEAHDYLRYAESLFAYMSVLSGFGYTLHISVFTFSCLSVFPGSIYFLNGLGDRKSSELFCFVLVPVPIELWTILIVCSRVPN